MKVQRAMPIGTRCERRSHIDQQVRERALDTRVTRMSTCVNQVCPWPHFVYRVADATDHAWSSKLSLRSSDSQSPAASAVFLKPTFHHGVTSARTTLFSQAGCGSVIPRAARVSVCRPYASTVAATQRIHRRATIWAYT